MTSPSAPAPTPAGGIPVAPRGRRRDHLLVSAVGAVLAPALLTLLAVSSQHAAHGRPLLALGHLVLTTLVSFGAQVLFSSRSSVGGLVAGVVAGLAQVIVLLTPGRAAAAPFDWARALIPTGMVLLASGLLIGGAWGMRVARRWGREQARTDARLARQDREVGVAPQAPPSRRRDHLLSLPLTVLPVGAGLLLMSWRAAEPLASTSARPLRAVEVLMLLAVLALTALGAACVGSSTLGARASGPLLVVAGLPLFLGFSFPGMPLRALMTDLLPHDPTGVTLIGTGIVLSSLGWGTHLARRVGRAEEMAWLRRGADA